MAISRDEARDVSAEIRAAILPILKEHGLTMGTYRTTYGNNYAFKFEATKAEVGEDGFDYGTKEAQDWLFYATMSLDADGPFEDPKAALGKVVVLQGEEHIFMGYSPRSPKYCLNFRRVRDGKVFKFTKSALRKLR